MPFDSCFLLSPCTGSSVGSSLTPVGAGGEWRKSLGPTPQVLPQLTFVGFQLPLIDGNEVQVIEVILVAVVRAGGVGLVGHVCGAGRQHIRSGSKPLEGLANRFP